MATERKTRDMPGMITALVFIGVGIWVLTEVREMSPLGSVFPTTIATALIIFSVVLIGTNFLKSRAAPVQPAKMEPAMAAEPSESTPRRVGLLVAMGAWIMLIPVLGFFVAGVLAFLAILALANYDALSPKRMAVYAACAVAIVAGFQWLMAEVLLIPVPKGILF